jgi:uncharacterized membrane protein YdbT with pleckstrin-like domain
MLDINQHLDSDEKMVYFFRPSRRAYIHMYILFIIMLTVCIYFILYFRDNKWFELAFAVAGLYPIMGILKRELIIFSSRYALTSERVLYSKGIFTERFRSFHYYAITDIELFQSLWGKIVNTGTLSINTSGTGSDSYEIVFLNVADPLVVKKKLNDLTPEKMHIGQIRERRKAESHKSKKSEQQENEEEKE